jgi:ornithine cyclodeaminase/thiomorpholine-carboxylate dehydrogenase
MPTVLVLHRAEVEGLLDLSAAVKGRHGLVKPRPPDRIGTLAMIGGGVQGEHHLRMFPLVREFDEIRLASLCREDAERVAALHPNAHAVDAADQAVRGADVVARATRARLFVEAYDVFEPTPVGCAELDTAAPTITL